MPIVVKARSNDSTNDVIRKFKRATSSAGVVPKARNRRYYTKPSQERAQKKIQRKRLLRVARRLKKRKNVSKEALNYIYERVQNKGKNSR